MEIIETEYGYKEVYCNGNIYHYNHQGELHNPSGPAIEYVDDSKFYYVNGKLHRADGPAVEYDGGLKVYHLNGVRHRSDDDWGPAFEYPDGDKAYYKQGVLHNPHGFAVITKKHKLNFLNGKYVWKL